jgi:hypothetical protein
MILNSDFHGGRIDIIGIPVFAIIEVTPGTEYIVTTFVQVESVVFNGGYHGALLGLET